MSSNRGKASRRLPAALVGCLVTCASACMHVSAWKLCRPLNASAHTAPCFAVRCLRLSMVERLGVAALGFLAALLVCADARSLRLLSPSNRSSVPHAFSLDALQCSQGSGVLGSVRSAACALVATEPLVHSGLSCTVCERLPLHALGNVAAQADAGNSSVAASGPAWETLVVIGCGDFLGNIVRGVTGAALLTCYITQAPHFDESLRYIITHSAVLLGDLFTSA